MARYGYQTYRGTAKGRKLAKTVLVVLVLVVLLAAAGYLFLQRYLVYSADGVSLDLPFLRSQTTEASASGNGGKSSDLPPLQVNTPKEEAAEPPSPDDEPERIQALFSSPYDLSEAGISADLRARMTESGANALILDMKTEDGRLAYVSQVEAAVSAGVSGTDSSVNAAVRAASHEPGLWLIANISCFRDNAIPKYNHTLSILTGSGYRWYDTDFIGWMNPYSSDAQDYLIALATELAQLGFDEIRLEHCGFPVRGKVSYISYGKDASTPFPEAVDSFLVRIQSAVDSYGVKLSVVSDVTSLLEGGNSASGHTLDSLSANTDRIYIPCTQEELSSLSAAAEQAVPDRADRFFVAVVSEIPEARSGWSLEKS